MRILLYLQFAQNKVLSLLKWCLNTVVECVQVVFLHSPTTPQVEIHFSNFFGLEFDNDQYPGKRGSLSNRYQAGNWYIVKITATNLRLDLYKPESLQMF